MLKGGFNQFFILRAPRRRRMHVAPMAIVAKLRERGARGCCSEARVQDG